MIFPDDGELRATRKLILRWFATYKRDLPWRGSSDPYRVWVSEIMLQQTTTQTVAGYFDRFMRRFPDIESLANAEIDDVLHLWEGLGYYRRARMLHAAAVVLRDTFHSRFPETEKEILALPGIGRYTCGAIRSIAFDQPAPILEANTIRLHARLLALKEPVTTRDSQHVLWSFAETILPGKDRGTFNQALMDFGALVCTPGAPDCPRCPLLPHCRSGREGLQTSIPNLGKPVVKENRTTVAFLVPANEADKSSDDKYLFLRYPSGGLWTGMWDFPRFLKTNDAPPELDDELAAKLAALPGCEHLRPGRIVKTVRHSVTRYKITLHFCETLPANRLADSIKKTNATENRAGDLVELAAGTFPLGEIQFLFLTFAEATHIALNSTARRFVLSADSERPAL